MNNTPSYDELLKVACILAQQCQSYSDNEYAVHPNDPRKSVKIQEVIELTNLHYMRRVHVEEMHEATQDLNAVNSKLLSFKFSK